MSLYTGQCTFHVQGPWVQTVAKHTVLPAQCNNGCYRIVASMRQTGHMQKDKRRIRDLAKKHSQKTLFKKDIHCAYDRKFCVTMREHGKFGRRMDGALRPEDDLLSEEDDLSCDPDSEGFGSGLPPDTYPKDRSSEREWPQLPPPAVSHNLPTWQVITNGHTYTQHVLPLHRCVKVGLKFARVPQFGPLLHPETGKPYPILTWFTADEVYGFSGIKSADEQTN